MGARQFAVVLAVALCVSAAAGTVGAEATRDTATQFQPQPTQFQRQPTQSQLQGASQAQLQQVTPDAVVLDVEVYGNGTAEWKVIYRTRLDDPQTAAAFRSYANDVRNNSTKYNRQFVARMNDTIRNAERTTDREMRGRNFGVRAEVREFPQRYGRVVYSFYWEGFAATEGDTLRVGDALSGLFLNEKTQLRVSWPEGYEAEKIRPTPDERRAKTAVWTGPTTFAVDRPRLVLAPTGVAPFELPWRPVAAGLLVVTVLGVGLAGGWWFFRTRDVVTDQSADPPEDLLSNEERVIRLLERRGGRVKQKAVVDEFGWTEAKTSQVVGSLREAGEIESFRLGRENVLALPQERQKS